MSLWEEGRSRFLNLLNKEELASSTLREFLESTASPRDAQQSGLELCESSQAKYGQVEIGGRNVSKGVQVVLKNIGHFVAAGDVAMSKAPETIGIAWFAVKICLNAIHSNFKLYGVFGTALTNITEMMPLIMSYDRLYSQRQSSEWTASDHVSTLFDKICDTYAAILDFCYSVKKHIRAKGASRLKHAWKDIFSVSERSFDTKIQQIQELKETVVEHSQSAFQEHTFHSFDRVNEKLTDVSGDLAVVRDLAQSIMQSVKLMAYDASKTSKTERIHDLATVEFDNNKKLLDPFPPTELLLAESGKVMQPGTCQWIFDCPEYQEWQSSPASSILCIQGDSGSGKSILLARVVDELRLRSTSDRTTVQFFSCHQGDPSRTSELSRVRVQNTLIYQVYQVATEDAEDSLLLQKCNNVVNNSQQTKTRVTPKRSLGNDAEVVGRPRANLSAPDLGDTLGELSEALDRKVTLVIDAAEAIVDSEQEEFIKTLADLVRRRTLQVKILVACQPKGSLYNAINHQRFVQIRIKDHTTRDIGAIINKTMLAIPQFSQAERTEICDIIQAQASGVIKYVTQVAVPFVKQPFVRPVSKWLEQLPKNMNTTYAQHIQQLPSSYHELFKTVLTWVLLADGVLTVQEAMDAFYGVSVSDEDSDPQAADGVNSVRTSVYEDQIRRAGGPFFDVILGKASTIQLKDPASVMEFCAEQQSDDHNNSMPDGTICVQCRSHQRAPQGFPISRRYGHLHIALKCLRHLNSSQFQMLYLPCQPSTVSTDIVSEPRSGTDSSSSRRGSTSVSSAEDVTQHVTETEPSDGESQSGSTSTQDREQGQSPIDEFIVDDSQDSEDRSDFGWAQNIHDDSQDQKVERHNEKEDGTDQHLRYEVRSWLHHVQQAEVLFSDEEKSQHADWKALAEELHAFFYSECGVFSAWKEAYAGDRVSWQPVHFACQYSLTSLLQQMIVSDKNLATPEDGVIAPLYAAVLGLASVATFKLLFENGADPNGQEYSESATYFQRLLRYGGSVTSVREFLNNGASCTMTSNGGLNALHYFAFAGTDPAVLDLLLDHEDAANGKVNINSVDDEGLTPLHYLMSRPSIPILLLKAFVTRSADVNIDDGFSGRPLYNAAIYGNVDAIKVILPAVDDVDDDNKVGRTALHEAAWHAHTDTVHLLLANKADPNRTDKHFRTPLFFACLCSMARLSASEHVAEVLLDKLVQDKYDIKEINKITARGRTPLREAAAHGFVNLVKRLLDLMKASSDVAIDHRDSRKGRNALHCAALRGRSKVVMLLLEYGADPTLPDKTGKTALQLAYERWQVDDSDEFEATVLTLLDHDQATVHNNHELLTIAAMNGSIGVLRGLARLGIDLNKPDRYGWTPLHLARQYRKHQATEFLSRKVLSVVTLPGKWISSAKPNSVTKILEDGVSVEHPGDEMACLFGDHPAPMDCDQYYYEVTLAPRPNASMVHDDGSNPVVGVGFCNAAVESGHFPGYYNHHAPQSHSWAYHGDDGIAYGSNNRQSRSTVGIPYGYGDTVGCGIKYLEEQIFFTKNGTILDELSFTDVRGRLFPVLGIFDSITVSANFGHDPTNKPFKWTRGNNHKAGFPK